MKSSNPYASPESATLQPPPAIGQGLQEIEPGSDPFEVGACIKRGFELTKRHFSVILGVGAAYIAVLLVATFVLNAIDSALGLGNVGPYGASDPSGSLLNQLAFYILSVFLSLGLCRIGLNLVSGKPAAVSQMFGEGSRLLRAVIASILFSIAVVMGFILFVIPGVYVILTYGQFMFAIVDRNLGVRGSYKYSASITTRNRINLLVLGLAAIGIMLAGALALLVGLVFAIPLVYLSWAVAYRWMQYGRCVTMDEPDAEKSVLSAE